MSFPRRAFPVGSGQIADQTGPRGTRVEKFDKYLLSQLLVLFGFFALVLVLVYWVNRAVVLFDQLIANGHSAGVFLEFSVLSLPNVIRIVLPIAAFAAAVTAANRLASDSELVVMQTSGVSPFRLARPVFAFGLIVALMLSVLTHVLVPASLAKLRLRQAEISQNATARLLREGMFLHPAAGITFFVASVAPDGTLENMFLADTRDENDHITYSARQATLVRENGGVKLVMFDGMAQHLDRTRQALSTTGFSNFVFDIGPLLNVQASLGLHPNEFPTRLLLNADEITRKATGMSRAGLQQIGHERISQALLAIMVSLIGFSAILMGGFSRFSLWRQVLMALGILIAIKMMDNFANETARNTPDGWPLVYLAPIAGGLVSLAMLWLSDRPAAFAPLTRKRAP